MNELEQERQDDIQEDTTSMEEKLSALEENEKKEDWYFTFGSGHEHENCYTIIHGTHTEARNIMVERFGLKWAFQYDASRWFSDADGTSQAERWGLREI